MKWPLSSQEKHLEGVNKYVIKEFRKPPIYNQDNLEIAQEAEMAGHSNLVDENLILFYMFGEALCERKKFYPLVKDFSVLPITIIWGNF